jgi:hypothetical protein
VRKTSALLCVLSALLLSACAKPSSPWAQYSRGLETALEQPVSPARFCVVAEPITDTSSDQVEEHNEIYRTLCPSPTE